MQERRGAYIPRFKLKELIQVIIDSNERYPYKFEGAEAKRGKLAVGDYALNIDGEIVAVAERKTRDNLVQEVSHLDTLKAMLQEMKKYPFKAVVFEQPYFKIVNPKKNIYASRFYSVRFISEVIADLITNFPDIQFIFCDNRKAANHWIYYWFKRIFQDIQMKKGKDEKEEII